MTTHLEPGVFYGRTGLSRQVGGFILSESIYLPGTELPRHTHEDAFFYLVVQGSSTETYGRHTRSAAAATLVFHPAGEAHAHQWHERGGRCFHVEVERGAAETFCETAPVLSEPKEFRANLQVWLADRLYREFRAWDTVSPLTAQGLAMELVAATGRAREAEHGAAPRWLAEVRALLHDRFAEPMGLDQVASAVGVHPAHLARVFRRHLRCTVGEYIRRLRVEAACREIARGERSLAQIALDAGFADQSHLTRTFRRLMGVTPGGFASRVPGCNTRSIEGEPRARGAERDKLESP
jgi:AraC family transcriptional regulator